VNADPAAIQRGVAILRSGGLVAFPTETVYGLGADALRADAVRAVFALKRRPAHNPLIVHVADVEGARGIVAEWPPVAERIAARFWPGPVTMVVRAAPSIPREVTGGSPNVAVRCPDHPVALALLCAFGGPLVAPSANPSGFVSPTTSAHVREGFPGEDLFILDGGPCRAGIESTVVSLATTPPMVVRSGAVPIEDLREIMPDVTESDGSEGGPLDSPGRLPSHYAPHARVILVDAADVRTRDLTPGSCALLMSADVTPEPGVTVIAMPADPLHYAARLYAALREADALRPTMIFVERPESTGGLWTAIHDRLRRAAAPKS